MITNSLNYSLNFLVCKFNLKNQAWRSMELQSLCSATARLLSLSTRSDHDHDDHTHDDGHDHHFHDDDQEDLVDDHDQMVLQLMMFGAKIYTNTNG